MNRRLRFASLLALAAGVACSSSSSSSKHAACDPVAQTGCSGGQACEEVPSASPACFDPVVLDGTVYDLALTAPTGGIADARVVALDPNDAPLGTVAISGAGGAFRVRVPAVRGADGTPAATEKVTLRADARSYASFPGGTRVAVPISLSTATHQSGEWLVKSALTDLALAKLTDATLTASLHGTVGVPPDHAGVLVLAERTVQLTDPGTGSPADVVTGATAIADRSGGYAIYGLGPATYTVRAVAKGSSFEAKDQVLAADEDAKVDLARLGAATSKVSAGVTAVGGASGSTSILLAPRSTFDDPFGTGIPLGRAVAVPGLRASLATLGDIATIDGVPDGEYILLAAFENDGLVRQVSGQGGTQPVYVTVAGADVQLASPKVVSAVTLTGPGADPTAAAPEAVTGALQIGWTYGNASATKFDLRLYDASGVLVWSLPDPLFAAGGAFAAASAFDGPCNAGCTYSYAGPALTPGMTYQVRITGWGINASQWVPYSRTEDLLGIFTWNP